MSKAVTNEEVEDVLSSIRRLVSEDKRPLAGLRSTPAAAPDGLGQGAEDVRDDQQNEETLEASDSTTNVVNQPEEGDRLVLTPALRVLPSEQSPSTAADERPLDLGSVARRTWTQDARDDASESAQDKEDTAPVEPPSKATVPDQDEAMDALDALVQDTIENDFRLIDPSTDHFDYADEEFWHDIDEEDSSQAIDAQSLAHDDVREVERKWDLEDETRSDDQPDDEATAEQADTTSEAPFFNGSPDGISAQIDDDASRSRSAYIPLTAKIAALEAVIGGRDQDYEPDGDEADELAAPDGPAMAWEDDVELDATGEPFVAPEAGPEPTEESDDAAITSETRQSGAASSADDQMMDEEALRDLVSEIVRAELQGALGERITRNVRKLVRREIHRALTAQEME